MTRVHKVREVDRAIFALAAPPQQDPQSSCPGWDSLPRALMDDPEGNAKLPSDSVIHGRNETYALLEVIGRGAYGIVYKGIGRKEGRYVAVKRVDRSVLRTEEETQLQEEISLLRNLNDPYIVKYVEAVGDHASPHLDIVMEYVEGGSLFTMLRHIRKSLIDRDRVLGEDPASMFIRQVVLGLRYLHEQGVVHSDIKGANILVTKDRGVKLADFGLASTKLGKEASDFGSPMSALGSPYWMAPEIVDQTGKSTASDIWSVGCTVIELLTGFPPNHHLMSHTALYRLLSDDCPPLPTDISADCEDFLRKCFNKDMRSRATAEELLEHRWLNKDCNREEREESEKKVANLDEGGGAQAGVQAGGAEGDHVENEVLDGLQRLDMYVEDDDDDDFGDIEFGEMTPNGSVDVKDAAADGGKSDEPSGTGAASSVYDGGGGSVAADTTWLREDPFRDIKEDPEAELERERQRSQKELWDRVKTFAQALGKAEEAHVSACESLVDLFRDHPEQRYNLIYDPGLLPILEVLEDEGGRTPRVVESTLRVALSLLSTDLVQRDPISDGSSKPQSPMLKRKTHTRSGSARLDTDPVGYLHTANIPHDMCLAGFLPAIMRYCEQSYTFSTRLLAARFLEHMLDGESTLHMFIACRGFTVFVTLVEDDVLEYGPLTRIALRGIERMLSMDNQRHKRDFCRRFVSRGLLQRLARNISRTMSLASDASAQKSVLGPHIAQLACLLQTFAARADPAVKASMTEPAVLHPIIGLVSPEAANIPAGGAQAVLCCLRDLSRDPQTHTALQDAGAVETLVRYLGRPDVGDETAGAKPRHFIVSTLHNLCIVSAARQQAAARAGVVPHLIRFIRSRDMNLRALCVDIYSGLACAGHGTRVELGRCGGVDFYVELLQMLSVPGTVRKWQARVLQAVSDWLEDATEAAGVEARLLHESNCTTVCRSLAGVGVDDVEGVLGPYWRLVSGSAAVNEAYGRNDELMSAMVRWLEAMYSQRARAGARGRLLLLRTLLAHARLWKASSVSEGLVRALRFLLEAVVLETDEAITVRKQASELLEALGGIHT